MDKDEKEVTENIQTDSISAVQVYTLFQQGFWNEEHSINDSFIIKDKKERDGDALVGNVKREAPVKPQSMNSIAYSPSPSLNNNNNNKGLSFHTCSVQKQRACLQRDCYRLCWYVRMRRGLMGCEWRVGGFYKELKGKRKGLVVPQENKTQMEMRGKLPPCGKYGIWNMKVKA
ncbi:hypothetical protein V6N12_035738 [Hibiscus sabdariffa]|uniref:Uncharacterized protein n=1 Tax=Hibiscus sabdariffa TaxID=183260 RepID=A0ABR2ENK7_9ROSI